MNRQARSETGGHILQLLFLKFIQNIWWSYKNQGKKWLTTEYKMDKRHGTHFTGEYMQMTYKHMKRCSTYIANMHI